MNILGGCKQGFWTSMKMDFDSPALHTYLMLHVNPDFQPCPPFQSAVTEELIKWVWLARAEKSDFSKNDGKNTEKDNKFK